jgi:hypothetical protein
VSDEADDFNDGSGGVEGMDLLFSRLMFRAQLLMLL